jgi:hypothetical protein
MPHTIVFHTRGLLRQVSLTPHDVQGTNGAKTTAYVTNIIPHLGKPRGGPWVSTSGGLSLVHSTTAYDN